MNLAFDLAIHTAPKDRSRAIDRYARAARLAPESDELLVLKAMQRARFSIISIVRRHPIAGLIVKDLFRGVEVWLVDVGADGERDRGRWISPLASGTCFCWPAFPLVPALRSTGRIIRLIQKWLRAGILEDGCGVLRHRSQR